MRLTSKDFASKEILNARHIFRFGALAVPLSMATYGLLVYFGAIPAAHSSFNHSNVALLVLIVAWAALGLFTFFGVNKRTHTGSVIEIALYYTLATLQIWLIGGTTTPLVSYIVLLLIATFAVLGKSGLMYGVFTLVLVTIVDTLILEPGNWSWAVVSGLTMTTVIITSLVIALLYQQQMTSHLELQRSRAREGTERKRAQMLINNFVDAVFSIDQKGIVKTYNAAALNILDTNDDIAGQMINKLIKLETINDGPIDVFDELSKSSSIRKRDDVIMRIGDEDMLRLEATFAPVQGNESNAKKIDSYVFIIRDITRMKSLEEERDEFISVVSHELRTPVAIAEGSLGNAELFIERDLGKQATKAVSEAHKQVLFLSKMINDLSTLSRAERGISDEAEEIDVRDLAHSLHHNYSPQAEQKGLVLNLDITGSLGKVNVSRLYLQELLQNFITNAIKYTQEGSVTLHISADKENITFAVSDTGIGIRKADINKIFKRFYRAEDYRTRETNGTGLGLYVSTKLAKKLGCKIDVESRINHGSKFSFKLPKSN